MTRLMTLALALAVAAQTAAAGPADTAPRRPDSRMTAADVASEQFADCDRIWRPLPAGGRLIISTHGPVEG